MLRNHNVLPPDYDPRFNRLYTAVRPDGGWNLDFYGPDVYEAVGRLKEAGVIPGDFDPHFDRLELVQL